MRVIDVLECLLFKLFVLLRLAELLCLSSVIDGMGGVVMSGGWWLVWGRVIDVLECLSMSGGWWLVWGRVIGTGD